MARENDKRGATKRCEVKCKRRCIPTNSDRTADVCCYVGCERKGCATAASSLANSHRCMFFTPASFPIVIVLILIVIIITLMLICIPYYYYQRYFSKNIY